MFNQFCLIHYIFDKVDFYNPKAKLSDIYYQCIDIYLGVNHEESLEGQTGIDRALPMFERSIPDASKILKGDILEYYMAYKVSSLFESCRKIKEFEKVDSLFNNVQSQFTYPDIIEIIKNQRDYMANYFSTVSNSPFTYSTIIPNDKK